jgi:hypothetical protein
MTTDDFGQLATRATIDLAMVGYFGGVILEMLSRGQSGVVGPSPRQRAARAVWTLGCLLYLAHVFCAFQFYHHWSHREAHAETARRTAELFGWNSGVGLYFNYAFTLAWIVDVIWWWTAPVQHSAARRWPSFLWHGFFLFMVVNATIVFETGFVRWLGVAGCAALAAAWVASRQKRMPTNAATP